MRQCCVYIFIYHNKFYGHQTKHTPRSNIILSDTSSDGHNAINQIGSKVHMDQFKNGRRICILAVREVKTFVTLQVSPHIYISTGKGSCVQDGQCEQTNLGQQKCFPLQRTHSFLYCGGWLRIWMLFAWSFQVVFSSSSAFQDCPQMSSLVVLMNLVCSRSSLKPQSSSASVGPWGQ